MAKEKKVARAVALNDFNRFADMFDIDHDLESMKKEDRESFEAQQEKILRAIELQRAVVNDDGTISYTLQYPVQEISDSVFNMTVPKGVAFIDTDKYKGEESMHRLFGIIAGMTGRPIKQFSLMDGRDTKFFMAVAALFLAS